MKLHAATIAILAVCIATTSCAPVSKGPPPPEIVALKSIPTKTTEPELDPTDECRPPGCKPNTLKVRMAPVVGPKMLTGDNDGPVAHWHYEYKNKRDLPDGGEDDHLERRMPPKGPKMLTGNNDGPVANWHYEYKAKRSLAEGDPLEARSPAKPACPGCTLGDDGNIVADRPEEAEGLEKRMAPGPKILTGPADGSMSWWHYDYKRAVPEGDNAEGVAEEGLDKRSAPECPECCTGRDCPTVAAEGLEKRMEPKNPKMLTGPADGSMSWWHYDYKRDLDQSPKDSKFPVGHGHYDFETKRAAPKDVDAEGLDSSVRWRRSDDIDAEDLDKRTRPECTTQQRANNECWA